MEKLLKFYTSLLKTAGLVVDADGFVSVKIDDDTEPSLIKGKRLVLPTMAQQRNQNNDTVFFNLLRENALRGESDVMEYFRKALLMQLNNVIAVLFLSLIQKAASKKEHAQLKPDQSEYLIKVKDMDDKSYDVSEKLLKVIGYNTQRTFVSIYTKPAGSWKDKKYNRVGVVSFPFYEELKRGGTDVFGVTLRKKDVAAFVNLLEYLFPNIDKPEAYNFGSNDDNALFTHTLMSTFMNIAAPIMACVELFESILGDIDQLKFDIAWTDDFYDLGALAVEARKLPMLPGNEGAPLVKEEAPAKVSSSKLGPNPLRQDINQITAPIQPQQQLLHQMPMQQPMMMQQPGYQNYPPVVPSAAPTTTNGKMDFNSFMRSNPVVAMNMQQHNQMNVMAPTHNPQYDRYGRPVQNQFQNYGYNPMGGRI